MPIIGKVTYTETGSLEQDLKRSINEKSSEYLNDQANIINGYLREGLNKAGNGVPSAPRDYPHRQTGNLRQSVGFEQQQNGKWRIEAEAHYAKYLEIGTYKMIARPFFMFSILRYLNNRR